jgi:hypothetical protein
MISWSEHSRLSHTQARPARKNRHPQIERFVARVLEGKRSPVLSMSCIVADESGAPGSASAFRRSTTGAL